jgi:ABC-type transport system involved in cytochrome c biogenesis permease subunit
MRSDFTDRTDPSGGLRKAKDEFSKARTAYLGGREESFNEASAALIAGLRRIGPQHGEYPSRAIIDLEVGYNRWAPFRWAWICCLLASVALVLSVCTERRSCYISALAALGGTLAALLIGLVTRTILKGSPPVTNLYESVVFAGFGAVLFGLIFGLKARRQGILAAALVIATLILCLADSCPSVLDPAIRPLPPVLRSNFWLAVHVATIMLSYAAFAVALGIANVTLGFYLAGSKRPEAIKTQSRFTCETLQAGTLLLVVGTFLGAAWADYSWGRFWGWDPKEVWALITLLGYLAILHARRVGWVGNRGLAAWSVICFTLVLMTWYGVNFLSGGLHNYGLGGGEGPYYVLGAIGLQFSYVAAAMVRSAGTTDSPGAELD